MSVGGEGLIVGTYNVSYGGTALGIMKGEDGYPTITQRPRSKRLESTDKYGMALLDSIHLGVNYQADMILMEYLKGKAALTPWSTTFGAQGVIGALKYAMAAALVLTAVAGTSAATAPATLTATKAVLADDFETRILYGPDLRTLALRFDLHMYLVSTVVSNFTET